jgi:hypothetical protein
MAVTVPVVTMTGVTLLLFDILCAIMKQIPDD